MTTDQLLNVSEREQAELVSDRCYVDVEMMLTEVTVRCNKRFHWKIFLIYQVTLHF